MLAPRTIFPFFAALALSLLSLTTGCSPPPREPQVASSSSEPGYAAVYATRLDDTLKEFDTHESDVRRMFPGFIGYVEQDKPIQKPIAYDVVVRADQAGHSAGYVERAHELNGVTAFFDREGEKINKKVGGSAQYAATSKGCNADVSGAAVHGLKEGIEQQSQESLRQRNEAHAIIERYRVSLGKPNATILEKQADDVAFASYVVNIDLVEKKEQVRFMISEADQVKKTADDFIAKEKAFQNEAGRTPPEKKASDDRIAAMTKGKASVDDSVTRAKAALPELDKKIKAVKKDYTDALEALKTRLKS